MIGLDRIGYIMAIKTNISYQNGAQQVDMCDLKLILSTENGCACEKIAASELLVTWTKLKCPNLNIDNSAKNGNFSLPSPLK